MLILLKGRALRVSALAVSQRDPRTPKYAICITDCTPVTPSHACFPSQANTLLAAPYPESAQGAADFLGNRLWAKSCIDPGFDLIEDGRRN
jgi:hypothetical protein